MKIRREYQLTLIIGKKRREFTYLQATAYETMKFMEEIRNDEFNLILWVYSFLNDICTTKKRFFSKNNISNKEFLKCAVDFEKIFETIQKTYFHNAFNQKTTNSEESEESMPFDAYLTLLCDKLNIDPLNLLKNYTFEQIGELGKGIVYVINMGSEEGQKKNERMKLEEKMKMVDKKEISDTLDKLEEWKKKNLEQNKNIIH